MLYVEFMKNFPLTDSRKQMGVRVISASWAQTRDCYFLDMMYIAFIKNFFLAESSELMGVRVISASWAQNLFIPTF